MGSSLLLLPICWNILGKSLLHMLLIAFISLSVLLPALRVSQCCHGAGVSDLYHACFPADLYWLEARHCHLFQYSHSHPFTAHIL